MSKRISVIDLFCGAGGFSEGFRQAGFEIIWAVDNWKVAVDTHRANHPDCETLYDDVIRLSNLPDEEFDNIIPDSEVIIGSPPCTFFSNSNRSGNGDKTNGLRLIKAFLRIVARKKYKKDSILKYWILENVPKAKKHIYRKYSAKLLGMKEGSFLDVKGENSGEYNAKYYGVPSNRNRYFCGQFPLPIPIVSDDEDLVPLKYILNALGHPNEKVKTEIIDPIYGFVLKGQDVTDHHYVQELSEFQTTKLIRLKQDKGYMGRMTVPENPERPARTIMATMSFTSRECFVLGYEKGKLRSPTIREVATLMSFPIDYQFYGNSLPTKYKLVGNAVSPKMAYAFARAILEKEGITGQGIVYEPIQHLSKIPLLNLNFNEIPIKKEQNKKITTRFKYHIPYFKFDTYRVELTNHHSNFEELEFKWDAEIHYNQGKDKAKVYTPDIATIPIKQQYLAKANQFFDQIKDKIVDFNEFQGIHCMTMDEIRINGLMGPYEILKLMKDFLDKEFGFDKKCAETTPLSVPPKALPLPITIGYFIMYKFVTLMATKHAKRSKSKRA